MPKTPENRPLTPPDSKEISRFEKAALAVHAAGIATLLATAGYGIYKIGEGGVKTVAVSGVLVAGEAVVLAGHAVISTKIMDHRSRKK